MPPPNVVGIEVALALSWSFEGFKAFVVWFARNFGDWCWGCIGDVFDTRDGGGHGGGQVWFGTSSFLN